MQGTLVQIALFIVNTLGTLLIGAVVVRFLLQVVRADFYNPLSQMIVKITNPLLKPFRKAIPGFGGFDLAAVILALVLQIVLIGLLQLIQGNAVGLYGGLLFVWAFLAIIMMLLGVYMISMFIVAIASFIAPQSHNYALALMRQLIDPVCRPMQKLIPPMGGFDFSFMAVAMIIYILRIFITGVGHSLGIPL
ncbi:YggT family protein [Marinagarivorans algicola]|uniref:YggT family protein n=1 Tax=Marinagarivorans algicola TaxID=1513270 RepID=UPI0006B46FA5|nr:YggT family protein [Marinagarivorans algicola]